jgi:hypothetical protein
LVKAGHSHFDPSNLPKDPVSLAYLSAGLIPLENKQKQELLEIESANELLERVTACYRREVALLTPLLAGGHAQPNSFSTN